MLDARPGLGWSFGANRLTMKEQLDLLQSFEPADRARAGHELVTTDLDRSADPLLDHVANEFDDRVLTAIARAVVATPPEPKESRRVERLREWAESELARLALEEAFLGREPEPVDFGAPTPAPGPVIEAASPPARVRHISWHAPSDDAGPSDGAVPTPAGRATPPSA